MTHINDIPAVDMPQMPFGGEKKSGLGSGSGSAAVRSRHSRRNTGSRSSTGEQPLPF